MTTKEKKAIENLLSAWETIPSGKYLSPADLQTWIKDTIKPDIDTLKSMISTTKKYPDVWENIKP